MCIMYEVYHLSFPKIDERSQKNVYYVPLIKKWNTCPVTPSR